MELDLLKDKKIGISVTGSFCTLQKLLPIYEQISKSAASVTFFLSPIVQNTPTRFIDNLEFMEKLSQMTTIPLVKTIPEAEPFGPSNKLDLMLVAPCTGNTLSKMANGITDTSVTMACKAHLRNGKPLVIFLSSNDALSTNARNLGQLLNSKNIFFVPFGQDDPEKKFNSLVSKYEKTIDSIIYAIDGRQIQPILL